MGFYKFTADNAPISSNVATPDVSVGTQGNYIKTKLKPVNTVDIKDGAGILVKAGKTKYRANTNITTKDTLSPEQITAKLEKVE